MNGRKDLRKNARKTLARAASPCVKMAMARKVALQKAATQTRVAGKPIRTYKCKECRNWHLTSLPGRKEAV